MTFEIWQAAKDGVAALLSPTEEDERLWFRQQGCRQIDTIEADTPQAAQDRFVEWSRVVCPSVTEKEAEPEALALELLAALG